MGVVKVDVARRAAPHALANYTRNNKKAAFLLSEQRLAVIADHKKLVSYHANISGCIKKIATIAASGTTSSDKIRAHAKEEQRKPLGLNAASAEQLGFRQISVRFLGDDVWPVKIETLGEISLLNSLVTGSRVELIHNGEFRQAIILRSYPPVRSLLHECMSMIDSGREYPDEIDLSARIKPTLPPYERDGYESIEDSRDPY